MQNNNLLQFPQNLQQPLQNSQNFPQNEPNQPQNQPLPPLSQQPFIKNNQQFQNNISNPNAIPPLTQAQHKNPLEIEKKKDFEKAEKERIMRQLDNYRIQREEKRKTAEMTL